MSEEQSRGWVGARKAFNRHRFQLGHGLHQWRRGSGNTYEALAAILDDSVKMQRQIEHRFTQDLECSLHINKEQLSSRLRETGQLDAITRRLRRWRSGENSPSFENWLLLCFAIESSPGDYIQKYVTAPGDDSPRQDVGPVIQLPDSLLALDRAIVGREFQINQLNTAWRSKINQVVVLYGFAGVGKSSLVSDWLRQLKTKEYEGAAGIRGLCFHDPTTDNGQAESREYIEQALKYWFAEAGTGRPEVDAKHLARLVSRDRNIIVLDAIETLLTRSVPGGFAFSAGDPIDIFIRQFLHEVGSSLCILTSRYRPAGLGGRDVSEIRLEPLRDEKGVELLRKMGLNNPKDSELADIVKLQGGSPLYLVLIGATIREVYAGSAADWLKEHRADWPGEHSMVRERIFEDYRKTLADGPEWELMCILGLFDRAAHEELIECVIRPQPVQHLNIHILGQSVRINKSSVRRSLRQARTHLVRMELVHTFKDKFDRTMIETHTTMREDFRKWLVYHDANAYEEGLKRVTTYLQGLIHEGVKKARQYGHASDQADEMYSLFKGFAKRLDLPEAHFSVIWARCIGYLMRAEVAQARKCARELKTIAKKIEDPSFHAEAMRVAGHLALHFEGDLRTAQACFEEAIRLSGVESTRTQKGPFWATDTHAGAAGPLSLALQIAGDSKRAEHRSLEAVRVAKRCNDFSRVNAHCYAGWAAQVAGRVGEARQHAAKAIALSKKAPSPWRAGATILLGWADAIGSCPSRRKRHAVVRIRKGIELWTKSGSKIGLPYLMYLFTEALMCCGDLDEAAAKIRETQQMAIKPNEMYFLPELKRLEGDILLKLQGKVDVAQTCYEEAVNISRSSGSKLLELRALSSLCELGPSATDYRRHVIDLRRLAGQLHTGSSIPHLIRAKKLLKAAKAHAQKKRGRNFIVARPPLKTPTTSKS